MGTIEFSGIVSAGLHRRAYRLMNPLPPWASVLAAIAFLGIPVLIADGDVSLRSGFPVILFALFWVWGLPEMAAWNVRPERVTGNATVDRLQIRLGQLTIEYPWSGFGRILRTESLVLLLLPGGRMLQAHAFGRPGGAGRAETVMRVEQAALPLIFAREFFNSADDFTRFGDWAVAGVPRQEGGTSAQGPSGG